MKRYKGKNRFKRIEKAFILLSLILFVWFIASWGEIIIKNCTENPTYNQANLFKVIIQNIN